MNYAESFEQFSNRVSSTDLMLYAGAALVLFVVFQDKVSSLKNWIVNIYNNIVGYINQKKSKIIPVTKIDTDFLSLITSWKKTRDLAEEMGRTEAVKLLDSLFPQLAPKDKAIEL